MVLNVDPGGYTPIIERLSNGFHGLRASATWALLRLRPDIVRRSYVGEDTMQSTSPVDGFDGHNAANLALKKPLARVPAG